MEKADLQYLQSLLLEGSPYAGQLSLIESRVALNFSKQKQRKQKTVFQSSKNKLLKQIQEIQQHLNQLQEQEQLVKIQSQQEVSKQSLLDVRKFNQQRKRKLQRQKQRLEVQRKNQEQVQEKQRAQRQQLQKRKKQQRQMMIEQSLRKMKERTEQRNRIIHQSNQKMKQCLERPLLHQILQEKFKEEILLPEIQNRKRKLQIIKKNLKPIQPQEFDQHQRRYQEIKDKNKLNRSLEVREKTHRWIPPQGSLHIRQLVENQDKRKQEQQLAYQKAVQTNRQKRAQFSKLVRQNYAPRIREKALSQQQPQQRRQLSKQELYEIGKLNLEISKRLADRTKQKSVNKQPQIQKKPNYLQHLDKHTFSQAKLKELDKIKNLDIPASQKLKILGSHAKLLSQRAQVKDRLLKVKDDAQTREQVTQLLLQNIRAKANMIQIVQERQRL